jgi:NADPH-dependent 2,4-dienoyl-CoA reductase/sulfur reductase-like enzyme
VSERLVVIGGDAAGMSAASQARRRRAADDLEIIAFERSNWVAYSACGEPYHVAGYVDRLESLVARTPQQFAAMDIEVRTRHEVTEIDLARRVVVVRDLDEGRNFFTGFDQLMIATGAKPVRPDLEGRDLDGVHELRTLDDAARLRQIADRGPGNVVVVGGGYIGLEAAEAFHVQGWNVTVVTSGKRVLDRTLHSDLGQKVVDSMRRIGITVVLDTRVDCISGTDRVESVGCTDTTYPADVVVLGLVSEPEASLAARAGITIGATGAIAVDDRQRTSAAGVWSGGDCAEALHRVTGKPCNIHLGTIANKAGRVAGINIGGEEAVFPGVLGTAITKVCDT